jgi:hypothetical protein
MPTSTSTTRTRSRERARSSLPLRHCYGTGPPPQRPRRRTYTVRRRCSLSKRPFSGPKARCPASVSKGARRTTGAHKAPNHRYTREAQRNASPTQGARQGADPQHARAIPRWRRSQRHQRPVDGKRGDAGDGGLPPPTGRALRQSRGPLADTGAPGNPCVQSGDPHSEFPSALPPAHVDRQVQRGDGPPCMGQRLPPGVPAGRSHHRQVIIRNLPLHLADSARTWLEHLPASQIHNWDDLVRTFMGNFQGTYVRPGNS